MLAHADVEGRSRARGPECYAMASAKGYFGYIGYVKCRHTPMRKISERKEIKL